jgi:tRNA-guanine family transglycosylase
MLASILISHHNVAFYLDTMRRVRQAIRLGTFGEFRRQFAAGLEEETGQGV